MSLLFSFLYVLFYLVIQESATILVGTFISRLWGNNRFRYFTHIDILKSKLKSKPPYMSLLCRQYALYLYGIRNKQNNRQGRQDNLSLWRNWQLSKSKKTKGKLFQSVKRDIKAIEILQSDTCNKNSKYRFPNHSRNHCFNQNYNLQFFDIRNKNSKIHERIEIYKAIQFSV